MRVALLSALIVLAGCATGAGHRPVDLAASIAGAYDNRTQFEAAPADLKAASQDSEFWIDFQSVTFTASADGAIDARWAGADGRETRARRWTFRTGADGALWMDVTGAGAQACALRVTTHGRGAWNAWSEEGACMEQTPDGAAARVDVRVTVMPTGVLYQETAIDADDRVVRRFPGGQPYDFRRR